MLSSNHGREICNIYRLLFCSLKFVFSFNWKVLNCDTWGQVLFVWSLGLFPMLPLWSSHLIIAYELPKHKEPFGRCLVVDGCEAVIVRKCPSQQTCVTLQQNGGIVEVLEFRRGMSNDSILTYHTPSRFYQHLCWSAATVRCINHLSFPLQCIRHTWKGSCKHIQTYVMFYCAVVRLNWAFEEFLQQGIKQWDHSLDLQLCSKGDVCSGYWLILIQSGK